MAEAASVSLFGGATGRERRASRRKSLLDTSLVTVDLTPGAYGLMLDISETGARIQSMGPVDTGAKVQIAFQIPELSKRIEGTGSVKWTDDDGRVGVCFESLNNTSTEELRKWIDSLPQQNEVTTRDIEAPPPELNFSEYVTELPAELQGTDSDADSVLQFLVEKVVERTHANGSAIAIGTLEDMVCRASSGLAPEVGTRISSESALSAECLRTGRIVKCDDTESDARVNPEICRQLSLRSLLIVPITFEKQVRGLLEVFSPVANSFDAQHVALLEELAGYAAQILFESDPRQQTTATVVEEAPALSTESIASLVIPTETATPETLKPTSEGPVTEPAVEQFVPPSEDTEQPRVVEALPPVAAPVIAASTTTIAATSPAHPKKVSTPTGPVTRRERSAAAAQAATLPSIPKEEPAAASQTRRSIIAVAMVVVLLLLLSGLGWWYGVRVSRSTPPAAVQTATQTQQQVPQQTQQQPISVPAAAVTETVRPKLNRNEPAQETAEDTIRSNGQERRVQTAPIVISPAEGPTRRPEEGSIVAPSISNLETNQPAGSVPLPAYTATPALRAPSSISGGQLLQRVEPSYPAFARQQRYQGDVVLAIRINKTGNVENVRRVSGNPMLSAAAIDAVKKWRYEPYRLNGQPQDIETTVTIKFKLPY